MILNKEIKRKSRCLSKVDKSELSAIDTDLSTLSTAIILILYLLF